MGMTTTMPQQETNTYLYELYTEAVNTLNDMSDTEVATLLYGAGITGVKGDVTSCPIAQYIKLTTTLNVNVAGSYIAICMLGYDRKEMPLDHGVQRFVRDFDKGYRPEFEKVAADNG